MFPLLLENVNKYIFPKLKKNEISMFLCCKNVNILLAAKYCTLTWCNSFMQTYISMVTIQNVFCVYTSFTHDQALLYNGQMLAVVQPSGSVLLSIVCWKKCVIIGVNSFDSSFNIFWLISSGPRAFDIFNPWSNFKTPPSVIRLKVGQLPTFVHYIKKQTVQYQRIIVLFHWHVSYAN
jgi:hypothetical protein